MITFDEMLLRVADALDSPTPATRFFGYFNKRLFRLLGVSPEVADSLSGHRFLMERFLSLPTRQRILVAVLVFGALFIVALLTQSVR